MPSEAAPFATIARSRVHAVAARGLQSSLREDVYEPHAHAPTSTDFAPRFCDGKALVNAPSDS